MTQTKEAIATMALQLAKINSIRGGFTRTEILRCLNVRDFRTLKSYLDYLSEEEKQYVLKYTKDGRSCKFEMPMQFASENFAIVNSGSSEVKAVSPKKYVSIIVDSDVWKYLDIADFTNAMKKLYDPDTEMPQFIFFEDDLDVIESKKKADKRADCQQMLKFISLSLDGDLTKMTLEKKPMNGKAFIQYCILKKCRCILANPMNIIYAKAYGIQHSIPKKMYKVHKNLCKGNMRIGIDTNIFNRKDILASLRSHASQICVSEAQIREGIPSHLADEIAYHGCICPFNFDRFDNNDKNIVMSFVQNGVDIAITNDYGFASYCKLYGLPCAYVVLRDDENDSIVLDELFKETFAAQLHYDKGSFVNLSNYCVRISGQDYLSIEKLEKNYLTTSVVSGKIESKVTGRFFQLKSGKAFYLEDAFKNKIHVRYYSHEIFKVI